ncbi:transmembrane protein 186 [Drosophila grimshawi]|uniref:Transmembrane protein 186 n=1 Tax=Drosophila grimshawi TaxID=7222 RepID=B4JVT0_DROGR|nr:transmembrane protein 186 [Drosophila grimshawi]EDV98068.1 GH22880 [Drosophila grimshawi]
MLQRLGRSGAIKLPLSYCVTSCSSISSRCYASTPLTESATTTTERNLKSKLEVGFTEWRPIYKLPLIRLIAAFNRLKVYQAIVTVAGTPLAFALQQAGQVSEDALGIYAAIGVSGLVTLSLGSYVARNIIGFIYINDHQDQLRLAYVDFWGRRKEQLVDIEDLLPDWEPHSTRRLGGFYQPICLRNDDKLRFKLLHRFGVITDPLLFEGLFGQQ